MNAKNPKVDFFFNADSKWQAEYKTLRGIVLESELEENLKWGVPCYTFQNSNVVLIHGFKEYCALLFHKGALIKDTNGILIQQTANVQSARQIRFTNAHDISKMEAVLKTYIDDAIQVEKTGLKVEFKKPSAFKVAEEFHQKLDEMPELKITFGNLTPGRQRAYLLYFSDAKLAKTRLSRVEKCIPKILNGKGLDDA